MTSENPTLKTWRSLDEKQDTPEFRAWVTREFPEQASVLEDPVTRRDFFRLMGASFALMGLNACVKGPLEKIVPYTKAPEEMIPGRAEYFATTLCRRGWGRPVVVSSHMGRPTKIEGNPDHPLSLGAADAISLAEVLSLYDPDRSRALIFENRIESWPVFKRDFQNRISSLEQGQGLCLISGNLSSPTMLAQRQAFLKTFPKARWLVHEPADSRTLARASQQAFGKRRQALYNFAKAKVIVSIEGDFLGDDLAGLRHSHDFIGQRKISAHSRAMNRLYALESTLTLTGAKADHRLPLNHQQLSQFLGLLAGELGLGSDAYVPLSALSGASSQTLKKWAQVIARDLLQNRGQSLIYVGEYAPAAFQSLAFALNQKLGNFGQTLNFVEASDLGEDSEYSLAQLNQDMARGSVNTVIFLEANPVYDAPGELRFAEALAKVPNRIHYGLYRDETAQKCQWHIPATHALEAWGDARSIDGLVSLQQPLISPLYGAMSPLEFVATLTSEGQSSGYDLVRQYWHKAKPQTNFDLAWEGWLKKGIIEGTAAKPVHETVTEAAWTAALRELVTVSSPKTQPFEIHFRPDPMLADGRYANNGWLQELPRPFSDLCWGNAALISPQSAKNLGVVNEDALLITHGKQNLKLPVWIQPGMASGTILVHLGHGRSHGGQVGEGVGHNAYPFLNSQKDFFQYAAVKKAGEKIAVVTTQIHHSLENRDIIRNHKIGEALPPKITEELPSLMPKNHSEPYAWGMSIDLNACVGCKACVVGCQSENNIPVVGPVEVTRGREMHWLRVDSYYSGSSENPETYFQPVPCMHCENAPCEVVCPVGATVHDSEGLNEMVYNRCVGTRYCSNNCPYKVRRFNFLQYQDTETPVLKLLRNPNVTVRSRGVMEKCTYCVQRINSAHILSETQDRPIFDLEIQTACQQACPTDAIVFGNIRDPNSQVSQLKLLEQDYALLGELGTKPRTTYLGNFRNPNPELGSSDEGAV